MYETFFSIGKEFEWKRQKRLADIHLENLKIPYAEKVLLHNGGSCNACTMKRCITFRCITKQTTLLNVAIT
jgi:hypothetical protein